MRSLLPAASAALIRDRLEYLIQWRKFPSD